MFEAPSFDREREVRKHIGDFTLFFAGLFPESLNRWIKERLRDKRAPAVGAPRQHFAFLCLALFNNVRAEIVHRQRVRPAA